jgi:pentapeptide repeat protein
VRRPLAAAALATLALTAAAPAHAATAMSGEQVVAALKRHGLSLTRATITTTVDFRGVDAVRHAFSCRDCVFQGGIVGDDVAFDGTLQLSGSRIAGPVLMRRATFGAPVVFGPTGSGRGFTSFDRRVLFTFARFADLATFARAAFAHAADFTSARFGGEAVFAQATFGGETTFERTAAQAGADFRDCDFNGSTSFAAAEFGGLADFSDSRFASYAGFSGARFSRDGTFVGVVFGYDGGQTYGVAFDHATVERNLVFDLAQFSGRANFRRTMAGNAFSFDRALLEPPVGKLLVFRDVSAGAFSMDVAAAQTVVQRSDRERVLELIETGAKARGDLGVANDARFSLEVMKSHEQPWWKRIPNVVFFRVVAGYFVRPFHPLIALFVLVAIVAVVRTARSVGSSLGTELRRFGHEFLDALALILPGGDGGQRRLETLAYRVLVVCALIGLANSNPTLREMFDALV